MTEDDDAEDIADAVFKHELKASEKMGQLFTDHEPKVAEEELLKSFVALATKVENPERLQRLVRLTEGIGQRLGSDAMVQKAYDVAEESELLDVEEEG